VCICSNCSVHHIYFFAQQVSPIKEVQLHNIYFAHLFLPLFILPHTVSFSRSMFCEMFQPFDIPTVPRAVACLRCIIKQICVEHPRRPCLVLSIVSRITWVCVVCNLYNVIMSIQYVMLIHPVCSVVGKLYNLHIIT
jgi:hypothetical protein